MKIDKTGSFDGEDSAEPTRAGFRRLDPRRLADHPRLEKWRRRPLLALAAIFSIASAVYWLAIASDRYVSHSRVIVQQTDLAAQEAPSLGSILAGDMSGNRQDQLLMRDYLLSRDMVRKLDAELGLEAHYSGWTIDPFSRLAFANAPEDVYEYFQDRVTVEFDEYAGVLVIDAQAFEPEMAQKITQMMVAEGGTFMNETAQGLADDQIAFLRQQVEDLNGRARDARQAVIAFQNRERIASPEAQAQSINNVIAQLEARRSELQVQIASQSAFLVPDHPILVELRRQVGAIDAQIAQQNSRLAGPRGGTLNSKAEQLAVLESDAQFAEEMYRTALTSLEKGQVESTRTIKTLSIIQPPTLPEQAELPDRWRMAIIYAIVAFLIAGVLQLLTLIIRDHRD